MKPARKKTVEKVAYLCNIKKEKSNHRGGDNPLTLPLRRTEGIIAGIDI